VLITVYIIINTNLKALRRAEKESSDKNILLTGNSELNDKIRGEKELKELAQDIITQLATYLKAQIGAIYLKDNGAYTLVGSYAFQYRKDNANSFKPGQGQVGQSVLEKK